MQTIIDIINKATDALPDPAEVTASRQALSTRDWAGFFAALGAFFARLVPLIIPLIIATQPDPPR